MNITPTEAMTRTIVAEPSDPIEAEDHPVGGERQRQPRPVMPIGSGQERPPPVGMGPKLMPMDCSHQVTSDGQHGAEGHSGHHAAKLEKRRMPKTSVTPSAPSASCGAIGDAGQEHEIGEEDDCVEEVRHRFSLPGKMRGLPDWPEGWLRCR